MVRERLHGVQLKIERAKKHIYDLELAIADFFASAPYGVAAKYDSQGGKPIYYLQVVAPVPGQLVAIFCDAIHNLRSALDHLAIQLFFLGPNRPGGVIKTSDAFPTSKDRPSYEALLGRIQKDLRADAVKAFLSVEAYNGGKGHDIWMLHQLDIIDKHRLLLTAGGIFGSVEVPGPSQMQNRYPKDHPMTVLIESMPKLRLRPADDLFPLKAGNVLYTGFTGEEIDKDKKFSFSIALNEPGIAERKPIRITIHQLANLVSGIVTNFAPCLV